MQWGMQSVLIQLPVGGDPGNFGAPQLLSAAVGSGVEIITSNFVGMNVAASMYALNREDTSNFRRVYAESDNQETRAPLSSAEGIFLGTVSRLMGFDGTDYRRRRVSTSGWAEAPSDLAVSATAAANTALTLTIPAAGAGLFHYVTSIDIYRTATAALAGTATLVITSTNFNGMTWSVGNAMAAGGTQIDVAKSFYSPIKSDTANTATTIVMPAPGAAVLWRAQVTYFTGT